MAQQTLEEIRASKLAYWEPHIKEWQSSNQSVSFFCRENKLNVHQFRYWQYINEPKPKKPASTSPKELSFLEISSAKESEQTTEFELQLLSGYRLIIPVDFNAHSLERLLKIIG